MKLTLNPDDFPANPQILEAFLRSWSVTVHYKPSMLYAEKLVVIETPRCGSAYIGHILYINVFATTLSELVELIKQQLTEEGYL